MSKVLELKKKLINHIMRNGEKKTSEKILLKSIKTLQKESNKDSKKLIKVSIINSIPTFKMYRSVSNKNKKIKSVKETPIFIKKSQARTSLAFKFMLSSIKKHKMGCFSNKLTKEILATAEGKGKAIQLKDELQKNVFLKKRLFKYYKF